MSHTSIFASFRSFSDELVWRSLSSNASAYGVTTVPTSPEGANAHSKIRTWGVTAMGSAIVTGDGSKYFLNAGRKTALTALVTGRMMPYSRPSFDVLPGTIEVITAQKAECLRHLEEYIAEYDRLRSSTIDFVRNNFCLNKGYRFQYYISPAVAGAPKQLHGRKGTGAGPQPLGSVPISMPILARPDPMAARADIESFYGALTDLIQNEVLDELVKLHPTVSWRDKPFAVSSLAGLISSYEVDLDPTVMWRSKPIVDNSLEDEMTLEENFPVDPSDVEIAATLVTKASWFVNMMNGFDYTSMPLHVATAVRNLIGLKASKAILARLTSTSYYARAVALIPSLDNDVRKLLELGMTNSDQGVVMGNPVVNRELTAGMNKGGKYHRGTLVLCAPGQGGPLRDKGAIDLFTVMGLTDYMLKGKLVTRKFNPMFIERLPRLLASLASGALVYGHPGAALFQTVAVTAKRYGFNVVQLTTPKQDIQSGIVNARRRKYSDAKVQQLVLRANALPEAESVRYWQNLLNLKRDELGSPYGDAKDRGLAPVYEECEVLFASHISEIPFTMKFNPEPYISEVIITL